MTMEGLTTPQFQSAFTVAVQLIFPSLTIGLSSFLVVAEALWLATRNDLFRQLYALWVRVFAVVFGLGAASVFLSGSQLGWDWSTAQAGVITTIQSVLVAAMLSRRRLGSLPHFAASLLTAMSIAAGMVWLVGLDSRAGSLTSGFDVRLAYMAFSAFLITSLGVGAASAWRLLKRPDEAASALGLRMALGMVAITAPLLFLTVDMAPLATGQPAASAAETAGWTLHAAATLCLSVIAVMLSTGWLGLRHGGFERSRAFLRASIGMGALGLVALMTGWIAGRSSSNPVLGAAPNTADWSPGVSAAAALVFAVGAVWILRMIARGPADSPEEPSPSILAGPRSTSAV